MITIRQLHKAFGPKSVLQGIDLNLDQPGRITAILGPNGSGKTTLIKCILGMVIPDAGEIEVQGKSIKGEWIYRKQLDYLPQIARFPDNLTVLELIDLIQDLRPGQSQAEELIDRFGLHNYLDSRLNHLSGGTKQKVNLTLAFMYDSPILILDEPTSGLDPLAMQQLRELILRERKRGKLIIITTHIMSFVEEMADDIVFLLDGQVCFQGTIEALLKQEAAASVEEAIAQLLVVSDAIEAALAPDQQNA